MQMPIIIIVLKGRSQGKEKKTHLWAGNVAQVFGFKNNFLRKTGCIMECPKTSFAPPQRDLKVPIQTFES